MITEEEWLKLRVGDAIWVGYSLSSVKLIKTTISKITKAQIKLNPSNGFYNQTYNKSQADCLFINKCHAFEYSLNLLINQKKKCKKKLEEIELNISELIETSKQLEQENGN